MPPFMENMTKRQQYEVRDAATLPFKIEDLPMRHVAYNRTVFRDWEKDPEIRELANEHRRARALKINRMLGVSMLKNPPFWRILLHQAWVVAVLFMIAMAVVLLFTFAAAVGGAVVLETQFPPVK